MAIVKEFYRTRKDGVNLYRTYSDADMKIQKVGTDEIYDEAIDVEGAPFTYVETEMPIEVVEEETE
jgi:hypothetical protein